MSGQSFQDRIIAARYSIAGQGLAKAVCKATTEEVMGPKKKHVDYLMLCTNEPNVSIPQMANLLIERTQHTNWVVVYKSLVTIHNLMNYGNERFTQYLASNNCNLNLENFLDKTGVQGYDMSTYIRRYAKYLNGKAYSYRVMAFDFCKVKRGKDDGLLRTMDTDKLLKTLPILQQQLDALLEFDVSANELTNGVVNACFMLLFKDLIRLFACYNDGIINLLELFFDMNKKQAREAFDLYKKFLSRMDRCSEFLKIAEAVGIDKGDIPDLAKAPSSLLTALEEHLKTMDDKPKKVKDRSKGAATASGGQLSSPTKAGATGGGLSEEEKRKIVEEEGKQLEKLKEQAMKKAGSPTGGAAASSSLFGDDDQSATNAADLFGAPPQPSSQVRSDVQSTINSMKASNQKMSDDLVGLGFDFGDSGSGGMELAANNPFAMPDTSASPWGPPDAPSASLEDSLDPFAPLPRAPSPAAAMAPAADDKPLAAAFESADIDLFGAEPMPADLAEPPLPDPPAVPELIEAAAGGAEDDVDDLPPPPPAEDDDEGTVEDQDMPPPPDADLPPPAGEDMPAPPPLAPASPAKSPAKSPTTNPPAAPADLFGAPMDLAVSSTPLQPTSPGNEVSTTALTPTTMTTAAINSPRASPTPMPGLRASSPAAIVNLDASPIHAPTTATATQSSFLSGFEDLDFSAPATSQPITTSSAATGFEGIDFSAACPPMGVTARSHSPLPGLDMSKVSAPVSPARGVSPIPPATSTVTTASKAKKDEKKGLIDLSGAGGFDTFGDLLKPQSNSKGPSLASMQTASPKKDVIVKGDIDSSLANLAGSLSMNGPPALAKQGLNWNPSKETKLTGGGNSGTIAGFTGTAPNMAPTAVGAAMNFQNGSMGGAPNSQQYYAPQMMGAQPPGYMPPRQPAWGMAGGQPAVGGFQQPMGMGQPAGGAFPPPASSQPQATTPSNDPFGSLL